MTTTVSIRFKFRRGTASEWTTANPVLLAGEPGLETDTGKMKFGDGTTAWNSLAYFGGTPVIADGSITLAKLADVATGTVFYRKTAGSGAPEVQTLATLKTDLGLTGTNSGDAPCIIDIFTSSGTWTKRAGLKAARTVVIGAGGGGAAGRKGAAGSARSGGGGGGGGAFSESIIPATLLGATETVTVGTGGAGAPAQSTNSTDGAAGTAGGLSSFGGHVYARGGNGGSAGASANLAAGFAAGGVFSGGTGGPTSVTATPSAASSVGTFAATGGGGGGSISTGNSALTPGTGGSQTAGASLNGGTAGTAGGNGGAGNAPAAGTPRGGSGGGGGAPNLSGNSGAGGNGADGLVIVFNYF